MVITHPVGIVTYAGTVHGWVLDLPGCIAGAADESSLDGALRLAIAEYKAWISRHGGESAVSTDWESAERLDGLSFESAGGEFLFDYDRRPLTEPDATTWLDAARWARDDLVAATASLPRELLEWQPPESALGPSDPWSPDIRTAGQIARHCLQLEVYYRESLRDGPAPGIFEAENGPAEEDAQTIARLREVLAAEPDRVFRPVHSPRTTPEEWTARKVIRRLVSHDRVHTAEIEQRRAWVLLGPPVIAPVNG